MEMFQIILNQPAGEFDAVIIDSLPDYGDVRLITKDDATDGGQAAVMLTFTVDVNGERRAVQTVTTMRLLKTAFAAINAKYDDDGRPRA